MDFNHQFQSTEEDEEDLLRHLLSSDSRDLMAECCGGGFVSGHYEDFIHWLCTNHIHSRISNVFRDECMHTLCALLPDSRQTDRGSQYIISSASMCEQLAQNRTRRSIVASLCPRQTDRQTTVYTFILKIRTRAHRHTDRQTDDGVYQQHQNLHTGGGAVLFVVGHGTVVTTDAWSDGLLRHGPQHIQRRRPLSSIGTMSSDIVGDSLATAARTSVRVGV